jgi:hypothetical protein
MTTIVTSLYDIGRQNMDGRPYPLYLEWFKKTLSLKSPMVIFIDETDLNFVKEYREEKNTKIIVQKLQDVQMYKYKEIMDEIINSKKYKNIIKDPNRIECNHSLYNIIQYSKFDWMETAAELNPFKSEYFLWCDAGLSRFFYDMDLNKEYPSKQINDKLIEQKHKILLQIFMNSYPDLFNAEILNEDYLKDNRSYVMGGMFGGGIWAIKNINKKIKEIFKKMIENNFVNNEQIILGFLLKKYPELFLTVINNSTKHRNYELINMLSL